MNSLEDIINHILYYGKKNKVTKKDISKAVHMANYFYNKNKNLKLILSKLPHWCNKR